MKFEEIIEEIEIELRQHWVGRFPTKEVRLEFDWHECRFELFVFEIEPHKLFPAMHTRGSVSIDKALELLGKEIILQRKES